MPLTSNPFKTMEEGIKDLDNRVEQLENIAMAQSKQIEELGILVRNLIEQKVESGRPKILVPAGVRLKEGI